MITWVVLVTIAISLAIVADIYTTKRAVTDNPSLFYEGNPFAAKLLSKIGLWGFAAIKLAGLGILIWTLWYFQHWANMGPILIAALGISWIAWKNKRLISKVRR